MASEEGLSPEFASAVCTSCWMDSHACVANRRCACAVCRHEEESNMLGMSTDTVDRDTQEWERIDKAVAFRLPNGDELLIARRVACPECGRPVALVLAEGTTIGYSRRHAQCGLGKMKEEVGKDG